MLKRVQDDELGKTALCHSEFGSESNPLKCFPETQN